jgi:transposase InsO family protein
LVTVKSADPVHALYSASNTFGLPASLLSDNAAVFTGRSRRGKVLLELELERLGIVFKHSTPYHPQTCGKVERFHQTLKRFLRKQSTTTTDGHTEPSTGRHRLQSSCSPLQLDACSQVADRARLRRLQPVGFRK